VLAASWLATSGRRRITHCIDGQANAANQCITDALGTADQPGPSGDDDDSRKQVPDLGLGRLIAERLSASRCSLTYRAVPQFEKTQSSSRARPFKSRI
jgi:hypothetical protein